MCRYLLYMSFFVKIVFGAVNSGTLKLWQYIEEFRPEERRYMLKLRICQKPGVEVAKLRHKVEAAKLRHKVEDGFGNQS